MTRRRPTAVFAYPSDADGTSEVAATARGQLTPKAIFLRPRLCPAVENLASGASGAKRAYGIRFRLLVEPLEEIYQLICPPDSGSREPEATRSPIQCAVAFVIRDFKLEDFHLLWRMDQECFPPGISYSKEELKAYMKHPGAFTLVAADGDNGTLAGFIVTHGGPVGHVITIDVAKAARRSGVGSLLLEAAEERLRHGGCRAVGLETAVDNVTALAFYKRHGYNVIRTWPRYYSNGVDALVLKKLLGSKP